MERRGLKPDKIILIDLPTSKRMRLHERVRDNVLCRSGIPVLSSSATAIGNALINLKFRWFLQSRWDGFNSVQDLGRI